MHVRRAPPRSALSASAGSLALLIAAASCQVAEGVVQAPGALGDAARGSGERKVVDLERARLEANALADQVVLQIDVAAFVFAQREGSPAGTQQALVFRIAAAESALAAATEPRPVSALANLVALASYESRVHEAYWSKRYGEADQPLVEAWRRIEADGLAAAGACLPREQVAAMHSALARWREAASDADSLVSSGVPRFAELMTQGPERDKQSRLLGTLGLDPLDSIEPAAREVARARELAERGLFLAQRSSRILSWRVELLTLKLTQQPDVQGVLQDLERTSKAAEQMAATAESLPEKLRNEGDALLQRISAEVSAQRAGLVTDLERTSPPTQTLLAQAEETLDAGTRMVQALEVATKSVDAFVARVSPAHPVPEAPTANGAAPATPSEPPAKPFDPVEYTALAAEITTALQELNTAVANLDRTLPAVQRSLDDTATRVDRSVETAYGLALRLVFLAVGAVTAAVLLVRALRSRRALAPGRGATP